MIGGQDIVMKGATHPEELDSILRGLRRAWPDALVEDVETGAVSPIAAPSSRSRSELLVYRDRSSFESWSREGLTDENAASLIHIVFLAESITWVIDDRCALATLVEEIRVSTIARRLSFPAAFYRDYERRHAA